MNINQAFEILALTSDSHTARIITENRQKISIIELLKIKYLLKHNVPVAKIIHKKWFYDLPFYTNYNTLDPRPDTETLIEAVLSDKPMHPTILDLGTGTGCIICSLVKNIPGANGTAIDISIKALHVTKKNIRKLNLGNRISAQHGNFAKSNCVKQRFDIIVSNPPYIAHGDKRVDIGAKHDPDIALYAKDNGLWAYKQIAQNAKKWIKPNGKIYLEIGSGMTSNVKQIFTKHGWSFDRTVKDLSGKTRVICFIG